MKKREGGVGGEEDLRRGEERGEKKGVKLKTYVVRSRKPIIICHDFMFANRSRLFISQVT